MKLAFQLAYRNLIGVGLKTWLNVGILAFTFLLIIFYNGLMDGWDRQAVTDSIAWEYGEGQFHHKDYDSTDPFTIQDGHGKIPAVNSENFVPILYRQGTIYPDGRLVPALIKGIPAQQNLLKIPTDKFVTESAYTPALIGERFAESNSLEKGDELLIRWKDKNGTYDATTISIASVFDSDVPTADMGQIYVPLEKFQSLTGLENEASIIVTNEKKPAELEGWNFKPKEELLSGLFAVLKSKKVSGSIMYILLMAIALLAIFDTQVLSVFRRQKEIGTYIALGMTRAQVVKLFTVEGAMYSIYAAILATIVGIPLFAFISSKGVPIPGASQAGNLAVADLIYPHYTLGLIATTIVLVVLAATIVSYMPARKIAKMDPVNALKGKIQ